MENWKDWFRSLAQCPVISLRIGVAGVLTGWVGDESRKGVGAIVGILGGVKQTIV